MAFFIKGDRDLGLVHPRSKIGCISVHGPELRAIFIEFGVGVFLAAKS